jgi:large subunit ribosomal protein L21
VKHGEGEEKVKISEKNVFAVVSVGSHQHKVSPDDLFFVEKLHGANVNDVVQLPRVLMLGSKTKTIIFKKRRRKYSRRWNGARQTMTGLRVLDVEGIDE